MNYLAHYERTITCASRYIYPRKNDISVRKEDEERGRERVRANWDWFCLFTYLNYVWLTPDFKSAVLCRAKRPFKVAGNALLSHGNNQIRLSSAITSFLRFFTIAAIHQGDIAILTDNSFEHYWSLCKNIKSAKWIKPLNIANVPSNKQSLFRKLM